MKSDFKISYPGSQKVYLNGNIHPSIKVGMRMVTQLPTVSIKDGERIETPNPSVYIYDTSGPYGDNDTIIDLEKVCLICAKHGLTNVTHKMPTMYLKCIMQRRASLLPKWSMLLSVKT